MNAKTQAPNKFSWRDAKKEFLFHHTSEEVHALLKKKKPKPERKGLRHNEEKMGKGDKARKS